MNNEYILKIIDKYIQRLIFIRENVNSEITNNFIGLENILFDLEINILYLQNYYYPDTSLLDRDKIINFLSKN